VLGVHRTAAKSGLTLAHQHGQSLELLTARRRVCVLAAKPLDDGSHDTHIIGRNDQQHPGQQPRGHDIAGEVR
jgi:hypothetical protein